MYVSIPMIHSPNILFSCYLFQTEQMIFPWLKIIIEFWLIAVSTSLEAWFSYDVNHEIESHVGIPTKVFCVGTLLRRIKLI